MTVAGARSAAEGQPRVRPRLPARPGPARAGPSAVPHTVQAAPLAPVAPVARVAVEVPLAHLDRSFDYLVPASMHADAQPGVRVRVRFAGRVVAGFVLDRVEAADSTAGERSLARIERVVSPERVLSPQVAALARVVADHYAGTLADVLRLAVPPRHARVEAETARPAPPPPPPPGRASVGVGWGRYAAGPAFLRELAAGNAPAAVWTALPGMSWAADLGTAVRTALAAGRGALVIVPDHRDAARVSAAVDQACGPGQHVLLTADAGPALRYRNWLAVRRGSVRAVVGTRAAMFAPVADLGLVVIWDDGDDLHAEPRAPYPHAREVLVARAGAEHSALLIGGFARTAEAAALVASGWAHPVTADRATVRSYAPAVRAAGEDAELARDGAARTARLPSIAWQVARTALASGPVLIQVPRRGYVPALACVRCRQPARCLACAGPLRLAGARSGAACGWCGALAADWQCPACGSDRFRAVVVGAARTAEELGRAFPAVPVRTSGRDGVLAAVGQRPALVVATPGAEPVADPPGYAAALLLDGWAMLGRPDLRAAEEALRRWLGAAALVRPGADGGRVVVLAAAELRPVQALLRWDPVGASDRELADRRRLRFPPATVLATVTGPPGAVGDLLSILAQTGLPATANVLGPAPVAGQSQTSRAFISVPALERSDLTSAVKAAQAIRSAHKAAEFATVVVDPADLG